MLTLLGYFGAGIILLIYGVTIVYSGTLTFSEWDVFIDLRAEHWSIKWVFGGVPVLIGSVCILNAFRPKTFNTILMSNVE